MGPPGELAAVKRRWFAVMGLTLLLGVAALVLLDVAVATAPAVVLLGTGSLLFVLGGLDPVPDVVAWYRFVGAGELLLGLVFALYWVAPVVGGSRTTADLLLAVAGVANVLLFAFVGVDWFLGGRQYDLSRFEPGPILGGDDR